MSKRPFKTVVIGFGQIAAGLSQDARMARYFTYATHAQVLCDHAAFEWVGVADPDGAAREAARRWPASAVVEHVAELATLEPEVAVITSPPESRLDILKALPSLRAVLVEKPLSVGRTDGGRFVAACRERGILVQVNFWRRGDPLYRALAQGDLSDRIGAPQAAFATYGNGLFNNGGHLVDFVRMLLGEVVTAQATGSATPANGPLPGDVSVPFTLTLADGARVAVAPLDFRHYREVGLDIWGSRGRLALYQESLGVFHYPLVENRGLENAFEIASDAPQVLEPCVGSALRRMYDNLADALEGGARLWSPGESALRTEYVLEAVQASAAKGGIPVPAER